MSDPNGLESTEASLLPGAQETPTNRAAFLTDPSNWSLLYHTAKNMQARQLVGVAERKARHAVFPRLPIDFDERYERRIPDELSVNSAPIEQNTDLLRSSLDASTREEYRELASEASEGTITFLNRSINFGDGSDIDWDHPKLEEYPLLWRLKLQAFEPFEWLVLGFDEQTEASSISGTMEQWLLSWTQSNPIGERQYLRRSWIPHSVSLRLIHWCRYAAWVDSEGRNPVSPEVLRQIYKNSLFLENHVEWGVGGNHLIENAAGLVMAGVLFQDHDQTWTEQGISILEHAAETQFLEDGGHFERSPMYHIQCLRRYITCLHICRSSKADSVDTIENIARRAGGFLRDIAPPDREIPLLNDSVYGQALSLEQSLAYLDATGAPQGSDRGCDESGYYWLGEGDSRMLVDAGEVGPPHLPGHSHNDLLSIQLWLNGSPVLTDSGTFGYAPTDRRRYARSIAAHNTVQVGTMEPIDVGGQYLMGKRVEPTVQYVADHLSSLTASYTKPTRTNRGYEHTRSVQTNDEWWLVWDEVSGGGDLPAISRLHFHPEAEVVRSADSEALEVRSVDGDDVILWIWPLKCDESRVTTSAYFPEFGVEHSRPAVEFEASDRDTFGFLLSTEKYPIPDLTFSESYPRTLNLDEEYQLRIPGSERSQTTKDPPKEATNETSSPEFQVG